MYIPRITTMVRIMLSFAVGRIDQEDLFFAVVKQFRSMSVYILTINT